MTVEEAMRKMSDVQRRRLHCALNLHRFAGTVIALNGGRTGADSPLPEDERLRRLAVAGTLAAAYLANLRWLGGLLAEKLGRAHVSEEETVADWREMHTWMVREGLQPPICRCDGEGHEVEMPFGDVHQGVLAARSTYAAFLGQLSADGSARRTEGGAK